MHSMYVRMYHTLGKSARMGGSSCMARMKASDPRVKLTPEMIISIQLARNRMGESVESSSPNMGR